MSEPAKDGAHDNSEMIARIAHEAAEKSTRAAMLAHDQKAQTGSFSGWLTDQGLIRLVLGIIALALTTMFCITLVAAVIRQSKFDEFEPYARLILGSLATIIAYLVGNFTGERTGKTQRR